MTDTHPQQYGKHQKIRFLENLGPYITRFKCGICGLTFRYDRTPVFRFQGDFTKYKIKDYKPNY